MDLGQLTVDKVRAAFAGALEDLRDFRGQRTLRVRRDAIVDVCRLLRDDPELHYSFLSDLSATDYWPVEPRFCINYHLLSMAHGYRVRLSVFVPETDAIVPSVFDVWPTADWQEREVFDMFGVTFTGHPDLRRILMPDDWAGHPLRRDYPLGYEEVQFTHNAERIQETKPRPKSVIS